MFKTTIIFKITMIITWNLTSFTSCPYRASRCCRVRATVAQNWRSLGLEIQVTGAHNRTPENAERRKKMKKEGGRTKRTPDIWKDSILKTRCVAFQKTQHKKLNRNGVPGRRHERMAREDIETPWAISVLFWDIICLVSLRGFELEEFPFIESNRRARLQLDFFS